uniref:2-phospho-L-lactate guanylyltransferase n=1 Tax=Nocardia abscessus TaxID=120957 RepID=UPI002456475B
MRPHAVHAVIAVKSLDQAKSRLADRLRPEHRARLVLAMLADTVTATAAVGAVVSVTVVTPDPAVADLARTLGADVHPEPRRPRADGLNAALAATADALRGAHGPIDLLALQADLPALRPEELSDMLAAAPRGLRSIVVDHEGSGTAALVVRDPVAGGGPPPGPRGGAGPPAPGGGGVPRGPPTTAPTAAVAVTVSASMASTSRARCSGRSRSA